MRYKLKLWKYNSYNADEAEIMLNQMAEAGWKLKNQSRGFIPFLSFERCKGKRLQYTIEVLPPGFDGVDDIEEKQMKEFYGQLGWKFVEKVSFDGMYLFVNDGGSSLPRAYYSMKERTEMQRSRIKGSFIIGGIIGFIIICLLVFRNFDWNQVGPGSIITAVLLIGFLAGKYVVPSLAAFAYRKTGRDNILTKIDRWFIILGGSFITLSIYLGIPMNLYLFISGQFLNHAQEAYILAHFSVLCTLISPILFLLGAYLELTSDRKLYRIGGIVMSGLASFGGIMMPMCVDLQLGLLS